MPADEADAENARRLADEVRRAIERSIERIPRCARWAAFPRRRIAGWMPGAVGSLVADYPLQLFPPARRGSWRRSTR